MNGTSILDRIGRGAEFSQAVADEHVAEQHRQPFGRCETCDRAVENAYTLDEAAMDAALIAEVGVDRIMEIAAEEGVDLFA